MTKFVAIEKRSKKERKAYNALTRGDWHGVKPVTRIERDKSKFSRKVKHKGKEVY